MKLVELTVEEFSRQLAGDLPAPGGGSVAALAGALSACLCAMAARLTLGRRQYREAWESMERVKHESDGLARKLLTLVDEDTEAYNKVAAAMKMPRGTDAQKASRNRAINEAVKQAAFVPLETLKTVKALSQCVAEAVDRANPNCVTDVGVAAQMLRAAAAGAAYNVRINLSTLKDTDPALVEDLSRETAEYVGQVVTLVRRLEEVVEAKIG